MSAGPSSATRTVLAFGFTLQAGRWLLGALTPGLEALLGEPPPREPSAAAPLLAWVHPGDWKAWGEAWAALAQGRPLQLSHRWRAADGRAIHARTEALGVREPDGVVRGFASTLVVEGGVREEVQLRLRAQMERASLEWQLALEAVPSPLLVLDLEGMLLRHNEAARALLGPDADYTGRQLRDCAQAEPLRTAVRLVAELQTRRGQATARAGEVGTERRWELTANRVEGARGWGDRIVVLGKELTELLALQATVRRSEAMSQLGAIVAGVAHEVRNPLFAISAVTDALEERFGPQLGAGEYTALLRSEVRRLTHLMQALLEYGRPEQEALEPGPVDPVLREALAACASLAEGAGVRLQLQLPAALPQLPRAPGRLVQALVNLVSNALQHSPRGAVVSVRAEVLETYGQRLLCCTVEDEGPGFPEEDLPRLAEPFFSRRRGGTGLGLSIVRRVVEEHRGTLAFANRPGGGGAVTLRFALPPDGPAGGAAAGEPAP